MNSTFMKFTICCSFLLTELEMCKFNFTFITEVIVKAGVVLNYVILRRVSNFFVFSIYMQYMKGGRIRNTSGCNAAQYNTIKNYNLHA